MRQNNKELKERLKGFLIKIVRKAYCYERIIKPLLYFLLAGAAALFLYLVSPALMNIVKKTFVGSKLAFSLLRADTSALESSNGRTNLLVLGIGGGEHEAVDLTDTIIFGSVDVRTADSVMLFLPRDIWIDSLQTKINAVYHYGEEQAEGGGFALTKDTVNELLDQPIHYAVVLDFEGFVKIIDLLGGIEVKVDQSFDDYKYPIPGKERDECEGDPEYRCRYEHLHFDAGKQNMDGSRALKFVRSRNAEGEEGTDFARSQRQKKVVQAVISRFFSYEALLNPQKINELRKTLGEHVQLDPQLNENEVTAFLSLFLRFVKNKNEIRTINLDYGDEDNLGFFYSPAVHQSGQWVLIPRSEDWSEIQKHVAEKIKKGY